MDVADFVRSARSLLFVPGDRPDRFAKAVASGADVVVLDLEDAVAPAHKPAAREAVRAWLADGNPGMVRVNGVGTDWHADDVEALREVCRAVMLPKAEDPAQVVALAGELGSAAAVVPLVETALGLHRAMEICSAPAAVRAAFGSVDLAAQLGVDPNDAEALRSARSALVLASAAAGATAPIDGVTTAVRDEAALAADCAHATALGFTAKLCIHPVQVAPVAEAFAPGEEQLRWARAVVVAAADGGLAVVDGAMVDKPVVDRARALLLRAGEAG